MLIEKSELSFFKFFSNKIYVWQKIFSDNCLLVSSNFSLYSFSAEIVILTHCKVWNRLSFAAVRLWLFISCLWSNVATCISEPASRSLGLWFYILYRMSLNSLFSITLKSITSLFKFEVAWFEIKLNRVLGKPLSLTICLVASESMLLCLCRRMKGDKDWLMQELLITSSKDEGMPKYLLQPRISACSQMGLNTGIWTVSGGKKKKGKILQGDVFLKARVNSLSVLDNKTVTCCHQGTIRKSRWCSHFPVCCWFLNCHFLVGLQGYVRTFCWV